MPHQEDANRQETKAVTVRLEVEEYERLKAYADRRGMSLNTVVREAVAAYGVQLARKEALEEINRFHETLAAAGRQGRDEAVEILREIRIERAGYRETERP